MHSKILEIAEVITKAVPQRELLPNGNMAGGNAGAILFFYHMYKLTDDARYEEQAYELVEQMMNSHVPGEWPNSHCSGLSGVNWLLGYLIRNEFLETDVYDAVADTETILYKRMHYFLDIRHYDFLHCAMGIFYHFLINDIRYFDKQVIIDEVVEKIEKMSLPATDGAIKWLDVDWIKGVVNEGKFNFGMAHGIPGIISMLAVANSYCTNASTRSRIMRLCAGGADYLLAYKNPAVKPHTSLFPYSVETDVPVVYNTRLAWCYGDPGIATALWHVLNATKEQRYREEALAIMHHCTTRRNVMENGLHDAGLCHGTSGIAQIFRRFHLATGDSHLKEAADYWDQQTLEYAHYADGIAGYKFFNNEHGYHHRYGFLEGLIGTGLSLIGSVSADNNDWDEFFLFS